MVDPELGLNECHGWASATRGVFIRLSIWGEVAHRKRSFTGTHGRRSERNGLTAFGSKGQAGLCQTTPQALVDAFITWRVLPDLIIFGAVPRRTAGRRGVLEMAAAFSGEYPERPATRIGGRI